MDRFALDEQTLAEATHTSFPHTHTLSLSHTWTIQDLLPLRDLEELILSENKVRFFSDALAIKEVLIG